MNGLQYFAIGAGSAAITIIAIWVLMHLWQLAKQAIIWASGKAADVFFGSVPGGRR